MNGNTRGAVLLFDLFFRLLFFLLVLDLAIADDDVDVEYTTLLLIFY